MNPLMPAPSNPTEQRARSNPRPSVVTTNHAARGIPDVKRSPLRFLSGLAIARDLLWELYRIRYPVG